LKPFAIARKSLSIFNVEEISHTPLGQILDKANVKKDISAVFSFEKIEILPAMSSAPDASQANALDGFITAARLLTQIWR
jgi:hypothetical protein